MRLESVEILPRGENGWGSGELEFAQQLTSLHAPNGSGKTPIVLAVVYGLGYPVTFRDDIASKCKSVRLKIIHNGIPYTIERAIGTDFFVSISGTDGGLHEFNNEKDFSNYVFKKAGLEVPTLTAKKGFPTQPYMATTLPIFYLDQDSGYTTPYAAPAPFIRDQFVESVRFVFGFSPKNSYDRKKDQLKLKDELESLDRRIVSQEKTIYDLQADFGVVPELSALQGRVNSLKQQLQEFEDSSTQKEDSDSVLYAMHSEKLQDSQKIAREVDALQDRLTGIDRIKGEIAAEADTLALNEEARRVFMSFSEICSSDKCCLFEKSSQAFAKNLLYLRDQIKDLDRNADLARQRVAFLQGQLGALKSEIKAIGEALKKSHEKGRVAGVVEAIRRLTIEHIEAEKVLAKALALHGQSKQYDELVVARAEIQDRLDLLETGGQSQCR